jgi:hypothetical protein
MSQFFKCKILILIVFLIPCVNYLHAQINVYDDFDTSALTKVWSTTRMESKSFEIQSKVVRKGKGAAKITLKAGDIVGQGNDPKDLPNERDEIMEVGSLESIEGIKYEYQFSMFLPDSFPIVPVRLVIAQ